MKRTVHERCVTGIQVGTLLKLFCNQSESCDGPASGPAGPISKSCGGSVGGRDIDVNDRTGTFGSSVARGFTDVALQPVLGILPKWWTGFGGCHCACFASGGADLA